MQEIFVSYSRKDLHFVDILVECLEQDGHKVLIDRTEIAKGELWWRRVEELIVKSHLAVFVISPSSVSSEVCQKEIQFAADMGKRTIPVLFRPVANADQLPLLKVRDRIDFTAIAAEYLPVLQLQREIQKLSPLIEQNRTTYEEIKIQEIEAAAHFKQIMAESVAFETGVLEVKRAIALDDVIWVRRQSVWLQRAKEWDSKGRLNGTLLREDDVYSAQAWLRQRPTNLPEPPAIIAEFIERSAVRFAEERERFRRLVLQAFEGPVRDAKAISNDQHAAQLAAAAAVFAEDPNFVLAPETIRALGPIASCRVKTKFASPGSGALALDQSKCGKFLVTLSKSAKVALWQIESGICLSSITLDASVTEIAFPIPLSHSHVVFSNSGEKVFIGIGHELFVWTWGHESLDRQTLPIAICGLSVSDSGELRSVHQAVEGIGTMNPIRLDNLELVEEKFWVVGAIPGKNRVWGISGSDECKVYDVRSKVEVSSFSIGTDASSIAISDDGSLMVAAICLTDTPRRIVGFDTSSGAEVFNWGLSEEDVSKLSISPDRKRLVSSGVFGPIRVWDIERGNQLVKIPFPNGRIDSLLVSKDGRSLFVFPEFGAGYEIDLFVSEKIAEIRVGGQSQITDIDQINSIAVSDRGDVALTTEFGVVQIWKPEAEFPFLGQLVEGLDRCLISKDGRFAAFYVDGFSKSPIRKHEGNFTGEGDELGSGLMQILDLRDKTTIAPAKGLYGPILAATFVNNDESTLVVATFADNQILLTYAVSGTPFASSIPEVPSNVDLSADARFLLCMTKHENCVQICVWNVIASTKTFEIWYRNATSAAISSDGQFLAVADGSDSTIRVLNLLKHTNESDMIGHSKSITSIQFIADDSRLTSVSKDRSARVWSVRSGCEIQRMQSQQRSRMQSLVGNEHILKTVDSSGSLMVTAFSDAVAELWDISRSAGFSGPPSVTLCHLLSRGRGQLMWLETKEAMLRDAPANLERAFAALLSKDECEQSISYASLAGHQLADECYYPSSYSKKQTRED